MLPLLLALTIGQCQMNANGTYTCSLPGVRASGGYFYPSVWENVRTPTYSSGVYWSENVQTGPVRGLFARLRERRAARQVASYQPEYVSYVPATTYSYVQPVAVPSVNHNLSYPPVPAKATPQTTSVTTTQDELALDHRMWDEPPKELLASSDVKFY